MKKPELPGFEPGMELIVTRWIGLSGTARAAALKEEELRKRFPAALIYQAQDFQLLVDTEKDALEAQKAGAGGIFPLGQGGILSGLWRMAEAAGTGLEADIRKIPIRQETVEICEYFDMNPYYLDSGGALLLAARNGFETAWRLNRAGIPAAVIGQLTEGNQRILYNQGNVRYLDRPQRDEIESINAKF